nr:Chain C, LEU-LEU-LEU-GLY-ILE-GLY-ILE-LEU-VAL-LEU [Homo sapiens]
LLLGIGILVL